MAEAIRDTFLGLMKANECRRTSVSLSSLCLGLKCGGSDGFSGLSANPAIGHTSDLLAALGGRTILSEFPELCGVEQELINRSKRKEVAYRFIHLMKSYGARAKAVGSGFEMNPSPGNMRDGLLTDAMKSAGAAKKGGNSPVAAVLDYPEYATETGLNLQCTPGNDVECVTAQVGAGANVVLFTTGLGTPTGNPIAPVVKLSTNSALAERLASMASGPVLLAANFSEGMLDAYDTNLTLVAQFADPRAPAGYAPFNVTTVAGMIFVTFAKQDAEKKDDVHGPGHGLIDVFDPTRGRFHRFATGSAAGGSLRSARPIYRLCPVPSPQRSHRSRRSNPRSVAAARASRSAPPACSPPPTIRTSSSRCSC